MISPQDNMPVTSTNESMEVDNDDNNVEEPTTTNNSNSNENPAPSAPTKSTAQTQSVNNVMASPSTVPSVTVSLHPLVIMNISEHWTRIRAQAGSPKQGSYFRGGFTVEFWR